MTDHIKHEHFFRIGQLIGHLSDTRRVKCTDKRLNNHGVCLSLYQPGYCEENVFVPPTETVICNREAIMKACKEIIHKISEWDQDIQEDKSEGKGDANGEGLQINRMP